MCGIFVDFQKAFDTVNHDILIQKLEHYGIRGCTNSWFRSYLSQRKQFVSILGFESQKTIISHGVPQGSVLGPLLFLIYINDLHKAIKHSAVFHFADDTNLLNISNSYKEQIKDINNDLKSLCNWLLSNKISLNHDKTEVVFFKKNNTKIPYSEINIKLNGTKVYPTDHIKYLGIYLEESLSGVYHCNELSKKLRRANGMLSKIRHYVQEKELKSIYYATFSSLMLYGCYKNWLGIRTQISHCHLTVIQKIN